MPPPFGYRDQVPRLLHAFVIVAFLVTTTGVMTVASADDASDRCSDSDNDNGNDDGCPDGAPWGCSSICARCPCTSVMVPAPTITPQVVSQVTTVAAVPIERTSWSAPQLVGIFRPPRVS